MKHPLILICSSGYVSGSKHFLILKFSFFQIFNKLQPMEVLFPAVGASFTDAELLPQATVQAVLAPRAAIHVLHEVSLTLLPCYAPALKLLLKPRSIKGTSGVEFLEEVVSH